MTGNSQKRSVESSTRPFVDCVAQTLKEVGIGFEFVLDANEEIRIMGPLMFSST